MANQMLRALMDEEKRGTLANPGTASALGPTIPMRIGATLNPMLERVQDIFPKDNPYGSFIERLIVGDSPERTGRMAEGYPHQYTGAGPNDPIIRPQVMDLAAALPIASTLKLAKAAAVPAAMVTSAAALNRLKAPGYAATSTDDIGAALLGQRLQTTGDLNKAMVGGDAGAAALARIGNTAPQQAMELAKQMESAGRSRDEIWAATADLGYPVFRGKDGQLRFEIDDSAAGFKEAPVGKSRSDLAGDYFESKGVPRTKRATGQYPELDREALAWADANRQSNPTVPVYESIIHPEMQQAYPDSNVRIGRIDPWTRDLSGYFDPATKEIRYGGGTIRDTDNAGTALHELQHATQEAEGFARGGTPDEFIGQGLRDLLSNINDVKPLQDELLRIDIDAQMGKLKQDMGIDVSQAETAAMARADELRTQIDNMMARKSLATADPYDMYRALAGEAEARQVQARMDMSPAERAYKPFYADFDVPEADQIVRYLDGPSAMVTYQGSPHKFDALDPTKIGTGEGAQAYGHGLYVAQDRGIGKFYQTSLGKRMPPSETDESFDIANHTDFGEGAYQYEDISELAAERANQINHRGSTIEYVFDDESILQMDIDGNIQPFGKTEAYLYEIDVPDEDIAKMLDWDAPLSEQPESVRKALDRLQAHADLPRGFGPAIKAARQRPRFDGNDLYAEMVKILPAEKISTMFDELGIPGIKYYDQGSRAAEEGTRNMVLFDDLARRAKVLKRNDETIAQPSVDEFIGKLLED